MAGSTSSRLFLQHAASDGAITPVHTGRSEPVVPTETDNTKEHLADRNLEAARRESRGIWTTRWGPMWSFGLVAIAVSRDRIDSGRHRPTG